MTATPDITQQLQAARVNLYETDESITLALAPRGHVFAATGSATVIASEKDMASVLAIAKAGLMRIDEGEYEKRLEDMGVPLGAAHP